MSRPRLARVAQVARREFVWHARRRSFVLTTLGLPVLGLAVAGATALFGVGTAAGVGAAVGRALEVDELRRSAEAPRVGWVEPAAAPAATVAADAAGAAGAATGITRYADVPAARAALDAGAIDSIFVVAPGAGGRADVVRLARSWAPPGGDVDAVVDRLRARAWPAAPPALATAMAQPRSRIAVTMVAPPAPQAAAVAAAREADDPSRIGLAMAVGLLLYTTIFTASSYLMQSVTTEKESRVIELLLTSVSPLELLGGKVVGLGCLGALQLAVWGGFGLASLNIVAVVAAALATAHFGAATIVLAGVYFVFGYLFYASLMGAVGALVPSFQESGPLTFIVLLPAWLPFLVFELLLQQPHGLVSRALSLFPPTAPLVMMLRLTSGGVPWTDVALSLVLLVLGAVGVLVLAARVFTATRLLAGEGFSLSRALTVLAGRGLG